MPLNYPTHPEGRGAVVSSPHPQSTRARLARTLRELRKQTGMSGNEFARQLGWQQSRVSKLETAVQLPNSDDLDTWVRATNADMAVATELLQLLKRAHVEYDTWRNQYRSSGGTEVQGGLAEREHRTTTMLEFWPAMIPGLLQTADYAREALSLPCGPTAWGTPEDEIESLVAARIKRQEVLYSQGKQLRFILGEAALWTRFGAVDTLLGQLDRLVAVAGLANVELGVVPFGAPQLVYPLSMFKVHDADMVMIESLAGEQTLFDPEQIAMYTKFFDLLHDSTVTGRDVVALIQHVAGQLRARTSEDS
ncbi:MAG: helix-turn-helix domain-containing protein [Sciscionella sp.]